MLDPSDLREPAGWDAAALSARLGVRLVAHGAIDSTMDAAAHDRGERPAIHVAERQLAGRGRRGRRWESPPGNLYATILWPDASRTMGPGTLAAIQVAWVEAVAAAGGPRLRCKWQNDGFVAGRKWAGALATRSGGGADEALLVGLGANLDAAPEDPSLGATALRDHWPAWPGRREVGARLLEEALAVLRAGRGGVAERLARWGSHDVWEPGVSLAVEVPGGSRSGRYAGLTPEGFLRLETETGFLTLAGGEAFRARPCSAR